jgi:hypothetical protein
MVSLEVIAILLSGISISASLFYYASVLKNQNETRQTQLFMSITQKMDTPEWWSHYRSIRDLPGKTYEQIGEEMEDPMVYGGFMSILTYFNKLGWLVKKGVLDFDVFSEVITITLINVYENTRPL